MKAGTSWDKGPLYKKNRNGQVGTWAHYSIVIMKEVLVRTWTYYTVLIKKEGTGWDMGQRYSTNK